MSVTFFISELLLFARKQANASLFGALFLAFIILTVYVDLPWFHRYDYLFVYAVVIQILLIAFKLETRRELAVIFLFHIVATIMEIYKTSDAIGSWHYPGSAYFMLWQVPLFAGFMYSAVGSYIARAWKLMQLEFSNYPPLIYTYLLAAGIYVNFFTHHFIFDFRYLLAAATIVIFWRTRVYFTLHKVWNMSLVLGFLLIAFFIWIAENIATFTDVWLYPNQQAGWVIVSPDKLGAWFLLVIVSFALVSILYRHTIRSIEFTGTQSS